LDRGGSAWRVADDGRALERRIDSTVAESVRHAAVQSSSAGKHLTTAWRATYGCQPDPGKAYGEAIKAVARPSDWELAMLGPDRTPCGPESVVAMIELLWQGRSDRHAGNLPTVPIPAAAALMAVHLAATLVHWFSTGAIHKKS
jgi:hypothetical protein